MLNKNDLKRNIELADKLKISGDLEGSVKILKELLTENPEETSLYSNLVSILRKKGDFGQAIRYCEIVIKLQPHDASGYYCLACTLQDMGNFTEAVSVYKKCIELDPAFAGSYHNIGKALQEQGLTDEAILYYKEAIERDPNFASYFNLGDILHKKGCHNEALACYCKAIKINSNNEWIFLRLGDVFVDMGEIDEAINCFNKSLALNPSFAPAYNNLGNALRRKGLLNDALYHFQQAARNDPTFYEASLNAGITLMEVGKNEEAESIFKKILSRRKDLIPPRWAKCMANLHVVYDDLQGLETAREKYHHELMELREWILGDAKRMKEAAHVVGMLQPFFLACQGKNDRDIQKLYGEMVCSIMAKKYPEFAECPPTMPRAAEEPVRLGIVSAQFSSHSIWKIPVKGWLEKIDTRRFHIYGYNVGTIRDQITQEARGHCHRFVERIPSFTDLCKTIKGANLHAIIYPEIGMDPTTLRLAALKLAPVQCASLGHPDTTGLPTIDYYLSSEFMEPQDGDTHYTEKLIRLTNLGFSYIPLEIPSLSADRGYFGIPSGPVLYLCSHALFTHLPQYDEIYPRIAQDVGDSVFLFIASQKGNAITDRFYKRIKAAFEKYTVNADKHVKILRRLNQSEYQALNRLSDVFLDTTGWSANNSTFEAIACDLPVVTMPGSLMRQRHCAGILTMMGLTETIASSVDEYVAIAARLGKDPEWRREIANKTAETKHRIYRDITCITAIEDFLEKVIKEKK